MLPRSPILLRRKSIGSKSDMTTPKFALTPDRVNIHVLNLASKIGIAAFHSSSAHLTVPFDGKFKDISMLQSQINRRATDSGWNFMTV